LSAHTTKYPYVARINKFKKDIGTLMMPLVTHGHEILNES